MAVHLPLVKPEQRTQSSVLSPEPIHLVRKVTAGSGVFVHGDIFGADECRMPHPPWSDRPAADRSAAAVGDLIDLPDSGSWRDLRRWPPLFVAMKSIRGGFGRPSNVVRWGR